MNILIIGSSKGSKAIKAAAEKRGHFVDIIGSKDLVITPTPKGIKYSILSKELLLKDYDLIFTYTLSRRIWHWALALRQIKKKYPKMKIVYEKFADPDYQILLTSATDMLALASNNINIPPTKFVHNAAGFKAVAKKLGLPVILKIRKPGMLSKGLGVRLVHSVKEGVKIIKEHPDATSFIVRKFVPNDGDYRLFVVGYKVVAAMKRIPKEGEFRSNISRGGKGVGVSLDSIPDLVKIAQKAAKLTRTEIAGVDIIIDKDTGIPYVLEINRGPQFEGVTKASGVNVALEIVKYFERLVKKR